MKRLARVLATWFGCGYAPKGPGTAGSLGALLVAWPLRHQPPWFFALLALILLAPAIWSAGSHGAASRTKRIRKSSWSTKWSANGSRSPAPPRTQLAALDAAFVLFRTFDIWKPSPVRQLEQLPGGTGIVLDDAMAGIYAALVLYVAGWNNSISKFFYGIS